MATVHPPRGAFSVGGHNAVIRLRRVLGPNAAPHPVIRTAAMTAAGVVRGMDTPA